MGFRFKEVDISAVANIRKGIIADPIPAFSVLLYKDVLVLILLTTTTPGHMLVKILLCRYCKLMMLGRTKVQ